ncbi:DUF397 domain-containing protein [Streptomyces sp. NPDC088864]|uniref:DUF397 domain-containing protein n=1 Tax=Streptomyces sp. NPDC088864 TaxID=3365910 RepID=UPI00380A94A0
MTTESPRWYKSSYSSNGGNCLEVATNLDGTVPVRDSKQDSGPVVTVSATAFSSFVRGVKVGKLGAV